MMATESVPPIRNVLTRIKSTTKMLQDVNSDKLKIERAAFLRPLFENTPLDRSTEDADAPRESDDVVLRKNLYHLAKKISNPNELILAMMHRGLLASEEIENILPLKDNLFKSVATFACVITRDADKFPAFLEALRQSSNSSLADAIENSARKMEAEAAGNETPDSSDSWTCQNCTFINRNASSNVCEMCFKSQDYMTAATNCTLVCQHCTYFNPPGHSHCDMCNNRIGVEEVEEDEGCGDQFFSVTYPSDCEEFVDE